MGSTPPAGQTISSNFPELKQFDKLFDSSLSASKRYKSLLSSYPQLSQDTIHRLIHCRHTELFTFFDDVFVYLEQACQKKPVKSESLTPLLSFYADLITFCPHQQLDHHQARILALINGLVPDTAKGSARLIAMKIVLTMCERMGNEFPESRDLVRDCINFSAFHTNLHERSHIPPRNTNKCHSFVKRQSPFKIEESVLMLQIFLEKIKENLDDFPFWYSLFVDSVGVVLFNHNFSFTPGKPTSLSKYCFRQICPEQLLVEFTPVFADFLKQDSLILEIFNSTDRIELALNILHQICSIEPIPDTPDVHVTALTTVLNFLSKWVHSTTSIIETDSTTVLPLHESVFLKETDDQPSINEMIPDSGLQNYYMLISESILLPVLSQHTTPTPNQIDIIFNLMNYLVLVPNLLTNHSREQHFRGWIPAIESMCDRIDSMILTQAFKRHLPAFLHSFVKYGVETDFLWDLFSSSASTVLCKSPLLMEVWRQILTELTSQIIQILTNIHNQETHEVVSNYLFSQTRSINEELSDEEHEFTPYSTFNTDEELTFKWLRMLNLFTATQHMSIDSLTIYSETIAAIIDAFILSPIPQVFRSDSKHGRIFGLPVGVFSSTLQHTPYPVPKGKVKKAIPIPPVPAITDTVTKSTVSLVPMVEGTAGVIPIHHPVASPIIKTVPSPPPLSFTPDRSGSPIEAEIQPQPSPHPSPPLPSPPPMQSMRSPPLIVPVVPPPTKISPPTPPNPMTDHLPSEMTFSATLLESAVQNTPTQIRKMSSESFNSSPEASVVSLTHSQDEDPSLQPHSPNTNSQTTLSQSPPSGYYQTLMSSFTSTSSNSPTLFRSLQPRTTPINLTRLADPIQRVIDPVTLLSLFSHILVDIVSDRANPPKCVSIAIANILRLLTLPNPSVIPISLFVNSIKCIEKPLLSDSQHIIEMILPFTKGLFSHHTPFIFSLIPSFTSVQKTISRLSPSHRLFGISLYNSANLLSVLYDPTFPPSPTHSDTKFRHFPTFQNVPTVPGRMIRPGGTLPAQMPTSPLQYSMGAPTTTYAKASNLPWDKVSAGIDTFFTHEVRGQDAETACLCLYSITAKLLSSVFLGQDLYFRTHLDYLFQVLGTNTSQSFEVSLVVSKVAIDCLRMLAEHGSRIEQFDSTLPKLIVSHITIKGENLFDQFCSKRVGVGHQHLEAKAAIELSLGLIVEAIVEWLSACPALLTSVATMEKVMGFLNHLLSVPDADGKEKNETQTKSTARFGHSTNRFASSNTASEGRNTFLFEDLANRMELNSSTIESGYDRLFSALLSDVFTDTASVATGETGHVVQMNLFETLSKELEQSFSMFRDSRQILSNSIETHLQLVGKLAKVYITSLAMEQPFSACCIDADEEAVGDDKTVYFSLGSETILEVSERSCPIETEYVCALERPHTATDDPTVVFEKRNKPIQHTTSVHVVIRNAVGRFDWDFIPLFGEVDQQAQAAKQAAAQAISLPTTPKALNNQHTPKLPSPQLSEDSESPKTTFASVSETGTSQPLQPFSTTLTSEKTNEDPFEVNNSLAAIETFNKLNVVTDDEHLNQLANSIAEFEEDIKPVPIEGEEEFAMEVSAVVYKRRESSIHTHLHRPSPLVSHAQFALRSPSPSSPPSPKAVFRRHPPPPFSIARSFLAQFKLVDVDAHLSLKQLKSQVATRTMMKLIDTLVVKKTYEIGIVYAAPGCTDEESILTFTEGLDAPSEDTPQPLDAPPKDKLDEQTDSETGTTQKTRRVSGLFWQFVDQLCWRVNAEGHRGYLGTTKIISKLEEKEVDTKDPMKDLLEAKQDDERLRSQVSARSVNKSPPLVSPQSSPSPPASLVEDVPDSLSQSRTPKSSQSFSERRPSSSRQMTPTLSPSPTFPRYKNASTPDELEGGRSRIERKDTIAQKISAGAVPQSFYYPDSIPEAIRFASVGDVQEPTVPLRTLSPKYRLMYSTDTTDVVFHVSHLLSESDDVETIEDRINLLSQNSSQSVCIVWWENSTPFTPAVLPSLSKAVALFYVISPIPSGVEAQPLLHVSVHLTPHAFPNPNLPLSLQPASAFPDSLSSISTGTQSSFLLSPILDDSVIPFFLLAPLMRSASVSTLRLLRMRAGSSLMPFTDWQAKRLITLSKTIKQMQKNGGPSEDYECLFYSE
ncbi:hypothetical protein BLNAU_10576 [Blattamonas nauphoetae]|uniref:Rap-GAP domain-containing protein n=1 Tax=Blattamonas nauphoetae TaxID=2049346 RepID=A0ABQ9XS23_9EUKA|nr:hypothetical protein BLNAU_10576 [Blattamonas nauphoetae]